MGALAFFVVRRPSRRQRRRAIRDAVYASYNRAGDDPEFQAEMREFEAEFDGTIGDGLDAAVPAR
jgi:hypothetical protein